MRILIIDNFDPFTYNLVQQMGAFTGCKLLVLPNTADLSAGRAFMPTHLVISPGPGNPSHTGSARLFIEHWQGKIPILGVCLGLQLMGSMYGVQVVRAPKPVHGQVSQIHHDGLGFFSGLRQATQMARYHSLVLSPYDWPKELEISAWTKDGLIMGIRHRFIPNYEGVQFHPESFMSMEGDLLVKNFLESSFATYRMPGSDCFSVRV